MGVAVSMGFSGKSRILSTRISCLLFSPEPSSTFKTAATLRQPINKKDKAGKFEKGRKKRDGH
jgi:hypothetical protein